MRIGKYEIIEELGHGGMGVVYKARHALMDELFALKVIHPEFIKNQEFRSRFLSEAKTLYKLRHPNIVEFRELDEADGHLYMVTELLEGEPLSGLLKRAAGRTLKESFVREVLNSTAQALGVGHAMGIVHRDIKPGNVFLHRPPGAQNQAIKLLDFGLARQEGAALSMTGSGKAVGTPAYLAPEVLQGRKADARADIYALGVIGFEMLCGRKPVDLPEDTSSVWTITALLVEAFKKGFPKVREIKPTAPSDLASIIDACLSMDPMQRPQDGRAFHAALTIVETQHDAPIPAKPKPPPPAIDRTHLGLELDKIGAKPAPPPSPAKAGEGRGEGASSADRTRMGISLTQPPPAPAVRRGATHPERATSESKGSAPAPVPPPAPSDVGAHDNAPLPETPFAEPSYRPKSSKPLLIAIAILCLLAAGAAGWWFGFESPRRQEVARVAEEMRLIEEQRQAEEARKRAAEEEAKKAEEARKAEEAKQAEAARAAAEAKKKAETQPAETPQKTGRSGIKWVYSNPAGLYFTKSEVTLAQYKACVAAGVCKSDNHGTKSDNKYCNWGYGDRGDHPMNCVKWYGADEFCRWVGGRLPTEDEWYAEASANKTREYPWGNEQATCNYAVMDQGGNGCGRGSTWLVCSKPAGNSVSGLCDMSGNVWEWTSTQEGSARVLRGGSWGNDDPDYLRASGRVWYNPDYRYYYFGFRCVRASR